VREKGFISSTKFGLFFHVLPQQLIENIFILKVCVKGGTWKAGMLVEGSESDYALIGEAVGPAFDFHDFAFGMRLATNYNKKTINISVIVNFDLSLLSFFVAQ
jgi:predicted cupin superfamily sugar epimerase